MNRGLGKGLQSLIPDRGAKSSSLSKIPKSKSKAFDWMGERKESIFNIEVDKIKPNPNQPRRELSDMGLKELSDSIKEHGVLQPLIVTKVEKTSERGRKVGYELVAGERRWRAAKMAGLPHVPVIIRGRSEEKERLEIALVENIQRENLSPYETALAFKHLQDEFGLSHIQIAQKVGKSRPTVSNFIRLLQLPEAAQQALAKGTIKESAARAILMVRPEMRENFCREVLAKKLGGPAAEIRARQLLEERKESPASGRPVGPKGKIFKDLETEIKQMTGCAVSISQRGGMGYVRIQFANQDELERITEHLKKME